MILPMNALVCIAHQTAAEHAEEDSDATISEIRKIIASCADDDEALPVYLSTLSELLYNRYSTDGSVHDLHEAYQSDSRALQLTVPSDPNRPERLCAVAVDLEALSRLEGDP